MATLICQARTATGAACTSSSKLFDGQRRFCGTHHKVKLRTDAEYKGRIDAYNADPALLAARAAETAAQTELRRIPEDAGAPRRLAFDAWLTAHQALLAEEYAARERQQPGIDAAEREAQRAERRARADRARALQDAARANVRANVQDQARQQRHALHAAAVALLAPAQAAHDAMVAAGRAEQAAIDRLRAAEAANAEAEAAIQAAIDHAMAVRAEMAGANEAVRVAAAALVAARAAALAPRLAFEHANIRWNAVRLQVPVPVFQPDPAGGINLRAMAADTQSVHRSGVISAVEAAIHRLCERPLAADQRTLVEAQAVLSSAGLRDELQRDFNLAHGFGVPYAKVLDHVWGVVRAHEHRGELEQRFVQEMRDGRGMCHTGKMTRLVNVLAGFDDAVGDLMPPAELFRNRIALLANRPLAEREPAARDLFREFNIPADEQPAWLEPLIEA
jgi:hypothetical protein